MEPVYVLRSSGLNEIAATDGRHSRRVRRASGNREKLIFALFSSTPIRFVAFRTAWFPDRPELLRRRSRLGWGSCYM